MSEQLDDREQARQVIEDLRRLTTTTKFNDRLRDGPWDDEKAKGSAH